MEPLDPKAELMRLADEYASFDQSTGIEMWKPINARDALSAAITLALAAERRRALEEASKVAAMFSMKPDRNLHPDVPWEQMSNTAQHIAHSAAQTIAMEISMLVDGKAGGT